MRILDNGEKSIGTKIRALRLSRHMTQAQLAGDSITRNMLSLIENGNASPSLGTLTELARRLEIPVGYFFASGEEETAHYLNMSMIGRIRDAYSAERYDECLEMCASLSRPGEEIRMISVRCCLALAEKFCRECALLSASAQLEKAAELSRRSVYLPIQIRSTTEFALRLIRSVQVSPIPAELGEAHRYPQSLVPPEMFGYITALSCLESGRNEDAYVLMNSGWIHTEAYLDLLSARYLFNRGETEKAMPLLRKILDDSTVGFFTRFHALTALERCASAEGDYKTAYQLSTQKIRLLELFST